MEVHPKTLHGLFYASVARRPDHLCLKFADHPGYSYREVEDAVNCCASQIVVLDDAVVAMLAHRSYGLVLSLLGILRAGKAYCPIEPDFPPSRVQAMLETASIQHMVIPNNQEISTTLVDMIREVQIMYISNQGVLTLGGTAQVAPADPSRVPATVSDKTAAYVLFTSGSTGKPKACVVPHRGSCLYAEAVIKSCKLDESMVFMLKTPYVFDVHVQDIFSAFGVGGTLVIADPGAHRDPRAMVETIIRHQINCCCFVPTLLVEFANYITSHTDVAKEIVKTLIRVLTIGEALMSATCRQLFSIAPSLEVHNLYGPTEASVGVSHQCCTNNRLTDAVVVPIGKPFPYVKFFLFNPEVYSAKDTILAEDLKEVADGEVGELFIGGDCLALGYLKNPVKTKGVFFDFPQILARSPLAASPFTLYKTGDLAKMQADGTFEYLGRTDFQVKIGGVRIECEEVSAVLKEHPSVGDAIVTAFDGPFGKALSAYLIISDFSGLQVGEDLSKLEEGKTTENVAMWGEVYNEMYKTVEAISDEDPTLNWSGYVDTYSQKPHIEPVIKEWVEWSCEQVSRHQALLDMNRAKGVKSLITELGAGNGMLLFRLAPLVGEKEQGSYIGTDISATALEYISKVSKQPRFADLKIDTANIAAHEILDVCEEKSNDMVICNGVTMYFPSASYLLECMQIATSATSQGALLSLVTFRVGDICFPFAATSKYTGQCAVPTPMLGPAYVLRKRQLPQRSCHTLMMSSSIG